VALSLKFVWGLSLSSYLKNVSREYAYRSGGHSLRESFYLRWIKLGWCDLHEEFGFLKLVILYLYELRSGPYWHWHECDLHIDFLPGFNYTLVGFHNISFGCSCFNLVSNAPLPGDAFYGKCCLKLVGWLPRLRLREHQHLVWVQGHKPIENQSWMISTLFRFPLRLKHYYYRINYKL